MKIHTVAQGTDAWHALRGQHFTASEAPAMMGASKYQSRSELLTLKKTGIAPEVTPAQQFIFDKGHAAEAGARPIIEAMIGEELYPVVGTEGNLLASLDGATMLGETIFEHKLWNEKLVAQVQAGELEPHYYWQLEQQLLVSGAEKAIFVVSDGTADNLVHMEYRPVPGRAEQLLAGWKQFEADLADHTPAEAAEVLVGKAPDELPTLRIELTGMVKASNLKVFEEAALAVIGSVKTDLQTDQDFADAKKAVKWCGDVESAVAQAKAQALSQTASIEELFKALDRISANARETRLKVDKQVKAQELSIKVSIKQKAEDAFAEHIATINKTLGRLAMPTVATDFAGAMKNKRTLASLRDAVDSELARAKIEANRVADAIRINLESLRTLANDHVFLFHDAQQLILKDNDDFVLLIKDRIAAHEKALADKAEADRLEAEAKRKQAEPVAAPQPAAAAAPAEAPAAAPQSAAVAEPARTATSIRQAAKPARRITVVIEGPEEAAHIGMQALGGTVVFAAEGDYSTTIEDAA